MEGKPCSSPTYTERLRARSAYKHAIRFAQQYQKQTAWNKINIAMGQENTSYFWTSWRSIYNKNDSKCAPVVDGCTDKAAIAEAFRRSFQANSVPDNKEKVDHLHHHFAEHYKDMEANHPSNCSCTNYSIKIEIVI